MDARLKFDKNVLNYIISQESKKCVGVILKRYEIIEDKDTLKKEIKELIYESFRNLRDLLIVNGTEAIELINKDENKERSL